MPTIDYNQARDLLNKGFSTAELHLLNGIFPQIDHSLLDHFNVIFSSHTQAYREVLLGCVVARFIDRAIDIHLPYVSHGPNAFNARDLDEKVINPFLQSRRIPSTKGPYLSTFRRQVKFEPSTRDGLRDKHGYDALLSLVDYLANLRNDDEIHKFLGHLLFCFVQLREASIVPLTHIQRFSLEQYGLLFSSLLSRSSGGLYPVLLSLCMFETIKQFFALDWELSGKALMSPMQLLV